MLELYLALVDTPEEKSKYEELYYTYKQDMYAVAYSILNNVQDAEDAVSQAFFSIAESFTKISQTPCHKLRSYVVIICKNAALNIYKKNKAERSHSVPVEYDYPSIWKNILMTTISTLLKASAACPGTIRI